MALGDRINDLATRIATEVKILRGLINGKSDLNHGHALTDSNMTGVLPVAQIPTGTTSTTVALGNHTHSTGIPGTAISSGTVATARLPASTESAAGTVERATLAEAQAGTDTIRYVSPVHLRQVSDARYRLADNRTTNAVFIGTSQVSLLDGQGQPNTTWTTDMATQMGWTSRNYAVSGMGYTLGGTTNNFLAQLTRARNDAAFANTDVGFVFIIDGANDARMGNSVTTAATTAINYAKTNFPNARVIIVPALWSTSPVNDNTGPRKAALAVVVDELRQVTTDLNVEFVEWSWTWHQDNPNFKRPTDEEVHYTAAGNARTKDMLINYLKGMSTDSPSGWKNVAPTGVYSLGGNGSTILPLRARRVGNIVTLSGSLNASRGPNGNEFIAWIPAGLTPAQNITDVVHNGALKINTSINMDGSIRIWETGNAGAINVNITYPAF